MTLQDFIAKYTNQFIDYDHQFGNQCVDLINQYCKEVLGIDNSIAELYGDTAFNIYQNYSGSLFEKITNTPEGVPNAGDIMFWDTSIGSAGHTAVFVSGDANSFNSFDQNWPLNSSCHIQSHSYGGVAGWLRLKNAPNSNVSVDTATFTRLVTNSTAYDEVCDDLGIPHNSSKDLAHQKIEELKNKPPQVVTVPDSSTPSTQPPIVTPPPEIPPNQPDVPNNPTIPGPTWIGSFINWLRSVLGGK